jgi:Nickel-dependent hydrogenase
VVNLSACPADAATMVGTMRALLDGTGLVLDGAGRPSTQKPCLSDPSEHRCRTADKVGYACYGCIGPRFPLSKPLFRHRRRAARGSCRLMAPERRTIRMELNRVEGDMEVRREPAGHTVADAWCVGTMYRGFEQILLERDPGDALVIAPRICGICSTSQLYAAVSALETAYEAPIAPNGTRIRNLCLMAESVMSDARHTFLMFTPDFCNPAYRDHPLYGDAVELFEPPFKGRIARETVEHTKRILAVAIAFGGQWPHSSYMLPGA